MNQVNLPPEPFGHWIWRATCVDKMDCYVFFRRDFTLTEVPSEAELWICARTHYHLYVNGRHFSRGPAPALTRQGYVALLDVAYALQVGKNVIAVAAHNTQVSRLGDSRKPSGLWCQLNVEGEPLVWTDEQWRAGEAICYNEYQPRVSQSGGFVETIDLRRFPADWFALPYKDDDWNTASEVVDGDMLLHGEPVVDCVSDVFPFFNLVVQGEAVEARCHLHVCFGHVFGKVSGVYAAETFVDMPEDLTGLRLEVHSDDPYYLFVNDTLVKSQGVHPHVDWQDPAWTAPRCYQQDELADPRGTFAFRAGWNRLMLVQQVAPHSAGATIILPDFESRSLNFVRGPNSFSFPGLNVMGPLKTPFSCITDSLLTEGLEKHSYFNFPPNDVAAHLACYSFMMIEETELPVDQIDLRPQEYCVLELERYTRGCLELTLEGAAGDVLDVVYGDHVDDGMVQAIHHGCRRVYSITLAGEPIEWRAFAPQGMRYVMLFARKCQQQIQVREVGMRRNQYSFRDSASFSCSEELFNQIWDNGFNTLEATFDRSFLSSAGPQGGQLLADCMIQALTSLYVFGTYDLSEKALREFAAAQYETGEIPGVVPSDLQVRLVDFSLLWPVWLEQHILHSGNMELLGEMLPHLERLLLFLESLTGDESVLIGQSDSSYSLPFLLDYDDTIDRRGISTGLNSLYCTALLKSAYLFHLGENEEVAAICQERANEIARSLRRLTWNAEEGLFADAYYDGQMSDRCALQTNVLTLFSGVAASTHTEQIFNNLFLEYAPFHRGQVNPETDSPYFKFLLLQTTFILNRRDWAADFIRYYWGTMVARGATTWWQNFSPDDEDFGPERAKDLCHGYGVSPNYFLISEIAGIRPASPGYHQIYFNPLLTAVEWMKVQVPTPHGPIRVDWGFRDDGELEIFIDSRYPLEVAPQLDPGIAGEAVIRVGDAVTILQS